MGTRTIVVFSENKNDKLDEGIPVYKHFDGYPSNILHLLRDYVWVNLGRITDESYFAAGFIRYCENYDKYREIPQKFIERENKEGFENYWLKDPYTGYGLFANQDLSNIINGWEDYYYKITPEMVYVFDGFSEQNGSFNKMYEVSIEELLKMPDDTEFFIKLEQEISENYEKTKEENLFDEIGDECFLDGYEKYCYDNQYFESVLHPIHTIEDHFGTDVQNFILKNTDIYEKYSYYTLNEDKKISWYSEKEAIDEAKKLFENEELFAEYVK